MKALKNEFVSSPRKKLIDTDQLPTPPYIRSTIGSINSIKHNLLRKNEINFGKDWNSESRGLYTRLIFVSGKTISRDKYYYLQPNILQQYWSRVYIQVSKQRIFFTTTILPKNVKNKLQKKRFDRKGSILLNLYVFYSCWAEQMLFAPFIQILLCTFSRKMSIKPQSHVKFNRNVNTTNNIFISLEFLFPIKTTFLEPLKIALTECIITEVLDILG